MMNNRSHGRRYSASRRRGFSFTEVLFAVMVLGIGFIMIAAMFPVTIRQTQLTIEDTHGANLGKAALAYLQSVATNQNFPVTVLAGSPYSEVTSMSDAKVFGAPPPGTPDTYEVVRGNFVDTGDPRFAWLALYKRGFDIDGAPSSLAQVFLIPIQSRNQPQFYVRPDPTNAARNYTDFDAPLNTTYAPFQPHRLIVGVVYNPLTGRGEVAIEPGATRLAAPGTYLVIARDPNGKANGRVYQLGNAIDETSGRWELSPNSEMIRLGTADDDVDLPFDTTANKETFAYLVGRGYSDPLDANAGAGPGGPTVYAGAGQNIAMYIGFIRVSP